MEFMTRPRHRMLSLACVALGLLAAGCGQSVGTPASSAASQKLSVADKPPHHAKKFKQGFEHDLDGWFNPNGTSPPTIMTRTRSDTTFTGPNVYANGIDASSGKYYARLALGDPYPDHIEGPFTRWGGYSAVWPKNGYTTRLDIYLDCAWAHSNNDRRIDWDSAKSNNQGQFERDYVFNGATESVLPPGDPHPVVGNEPGGFVFSASNNAFRSGANPHNPGRSPVHIHATGWYTFQHVFYEDANHRVACNLSIIDSCGNVVHCWTLPQAPDPSDPIATTGGNRYGWFANNEIPGLAIDDAVRFDNGHDNDTDDCDCDGDD